MGLVTKAFTFAPQTLAASAEVNVNFDTLYALVNGNIEADNLAPNAVIADKITDDSINFNKIDWGTGADQVQGTELTHWRIGQGLANYLDIAVPALTGNRTWTLQDSSDVFVGRDTTDTLTNKTLTSPVINTADIDGGTIDGAAIGETTPAAGAFTSISGTGLTINSVDIEKALVPIGTIIPIYDFGGALTFDSDYYAYCNGQSKTIGGVSRTLPDLSNRYIVGFGIEGAGTGANGVGNATWSVDPVGEASHQVSLTHTHANSLTYVTPRHYHGRGTFTVSSSTGSESADHTHAVSGGSHRHYLTDYLYWNNQPSGGSTTAKSPVADTSNGGSSHTSNTSNTTHTHTVGGRSAAHTHSVTNTYSGSIGYTSGENGDGSGYASAKNVGGSITEWTNGSQSIQPRSIRCRYIMRIK